MVLEGSQGWKGPSRVRSRFYLWESERAEIQGNKLKGWSEKLKIELGRTFAGFGFSLALREHRQTLLKCEPADLLAIAFTPKPLVIEVKVTYGGLDKMLMGGRTFQGDRFVIHPKVPAIAKLFVKAPDTRIWLIHTPPTDFLRWEGQLVEPSDEDIRVDRLPGPESRPAEPE